MQSFCVQLLLVRRLYQSLQSKGPRSRQGTDIDYRLLIFIKII
jgi:hypothetical protein